MKLMYAPPSPFARKVRVAAIELGLADDIELVLTEVVPGKANEAYSKNCNPLRKIPTLLMDDGTTIYDSTVICEYLDARAGGGLIPASGDDRWRVLTHNALAQGMCEAAVLIRYETVLRPDESRWQTWIDDQWDRILNGLDRFEHLDGTLDEPLNLAHITLGCLLGYIEFRFPETDWRGDVPTLAAWFDGLTDRESFVNTDPAAAP
jgi:glutathione S-transferase